MLVILALKGLRQDSEFEIRLGYVGRTPLRGEGGNIMVCEYVNYISIKTSERTVK